MASNIIKCFNTKQTIHLKQKILNLSQIIERKWLSTDRSIKPIVDSNQLEVFEQKHKKQLKEKVLDRVSHTGQVCQSLNIDITVQTNHFN